MTDEEKSINSETVDNKVPEGVEYDVFAENGKTSDKEINREYLNQIFNGGLKIDHDSVTFTRTMYTKMYMDIEEHFEIQRKEMVKWICICQALAVVALGFAILPIMQTGMFLTYMYGIAGLVNFILMLILIMFAIAMEWFTLGYIKKFRKLKKERERNIERLNQRREEAKFTGTYDAE